MVSIIICSVNAAFLKQVSKNIADTIGVPYEIIATDNMVAPEGICAVYNKGIEKSKYDILCFMHEDTLIQTNNWGQKLVSLFKDDQQLGLVGIAGSNYKTLTPSGWGSVGVETIFSNLIQSYKHKKKKPKHVYRNPNNEKLTNVVCIDGVFMCTTKKVTKEFKFDEETFKGFHGYDLDFSLAVGQKYKVAVTYDVLLNHFSEGSFDQTWLKESIKLHHKWNQHLPKDVGTTLTPEQMITIEKVTFKKFIDQLIVLKFPISTAYKTLWKDRKFYNLNPKLFFKLKFHILKRYLTLTDTSNVQPL